MKIDHSFWYTNHVQWHTNHEGLVDPRFKKAGISDFNNLRPVSNLLYVSKLLELAVFDQMHARFCNNDHYLMLQSAYRQGPLFALVEI